MCIPIASRQHSKIRFRVVYISGAHSQSLTRLSLAYNMYPHYQTVVSSSLNHYTGWQFPVKRTVVGDECRSVLLLEAKDASYMVNRYVISVPVRSMMVVLGIGLRSHRVKDQAVSHTSFQFYPVRNNRTRRRYGD